MHDGGPEGDGEDGVGEDHERDVDGEEGGVLQGRDEGLLAVAWEDEGAGIEAEGDWHDEGPEDAGAEASFEEDVDESDGEAEGHRELEEVAERGVVEGDGAEDEAEAAEDDGGPGSEAGDAAEGVGTGGDESGGGAAAHWGGGGAGRDAGCDARRGGLDERSGCGGDSGGAVGEDAEARGEGVDDVQRGCNAGGGESRPEQVEGESLHA